MSADHSEVGLEGLRQTMLLKLIKPWGQCQCICIDTSILSEVDRATKATLEKYIPHCQDISVTLHPETKLTIIISTVSNISNVTLQ